MSASHIISLVIILASIVITVLNIALICLSKRNSKPKPKVNPEYNAETERKLNQAFKVIDMNLHTASHLIRIAYEISTAAQDYRDWILSVVTKNSHSTVDEHRGEELHRKLRTLTKKYNLLTEEEVPHD